MIELRMIQDRKNGTVSARLAVSRPIHHTPKARLNNGSGTHGAGFDCNIESTISKAIVPEFSSRPAQSQDLRVSGGIIQVARAVVRSRDHPSILDDDGAHRDFLLVESAPGLAQSQAHELHVLRVNSGNWAHLLHDAIVTRAGYCAATPLPTSALPQSFFWRQLLPGHLYKLLRS